MATTASIGEISPKVSDSKRDCRLDSTQSNQRFSEHAQINNQLYDDSTES